jgi:lambda repressor-like predicted transcriptional regulator
MRSRRRLLAGGAAALVVVFGAGAALGASGATNPASSFLGDVAKKLGISEEKLTDAIKAAQIDRIDAAQARGDITKEQADALKTQVRNGKAPTILPGFRAAAPPTLGLPGLGKGFGGRLFFKGGLGLGKSESLAAAADYLGMTQAELRDALANGTSPADLAKQKGKSVDGLKAAVKKPITAKVDQAVKDGLLTKEQGDDLVAELSKAVDAFVDGDFAGPLGLGLRALGPLGLGKGFGHHGAPFHFGFGLGGTDVLSSAADYLGMTNAQLRDAIANGKSLSEIAKDKGKSVDGLKDAVKKPIKDKVDKAVEEGLLTKEQGDQLYGALSSGVDAFIDSGLSFKLGPGPRGFRFDFHMDGDTPQGSRSEDDVPAVPQVF